MADCPFAKPEPISGSSGDNLGGPYKIVHHTTEGSSASGAFAAFRKNRSDPHFTVDRTTVYQHIDTDVAARALRNAPGGVQTNRDSAVQIEVVGFAGANKHPQTLKNVARLCRWIEKTHQVPRQWPAGPPRSPLNGGDPGGHNRDPKIWEATSGHYGHSQVPENVHWDPAYTKVEVEYLMAATFDDDGNLTNPEHAAVKALANRPLSLDAPEPVIMTDHADVGEPGDD
ncbi:N-acetylmuramoyl-L-alanine amidase [Sphingomonas sp. NPDC079357]|uniref:N-acetylmuramoyl-L-alanine amidase n=1 Tax=Sphingomonas sp. NPDC079357 TaxID=3364518 RepID=UPI00384D01CE